MGEERETSDEGKTLSFPRRKTLQASLTVIGAITLSGCSNGETTDEDDAMTETDSDADERALCADGVERSATEVSIPDSVRPVSELPALDGVPDTLEIGDGERIESADAWRDERRSELTDLFRQYVYGYAPPVPKRTFDVELESDPVLDGAARLKRVTIRFPELPDEAPTVRLDLFVPTGTEEPSPVIFGLNSFGNHAVADLPSLAFPYPARQSDDTSNTLFDRGDQTDYWHVRETIDRGYAFATACAQDVQPDSPEMALSKHLWESHGESPSVLWGGALAMWAWGISRCVDYLAEDCDIQTDGIAAFGHSRAGKATLLAGATDERISLVIPHQSGTGGVALNRLESTPSDGETVEDIATTFPYWFDGYYPMFATAVDRFPMDQHHLVGLVAPRAILATESAPTADTWTNPEASLESIRRASDVWELLEDRSIGRDDVYQEGGSIPEDAPPVLHYRRDVEHTMTPEYWDAIYDFADQHLERVPNQTE